MAVDQSPQVLSPDMGAAPTFVAADGAGHKFKNTGNQILWVRNAHVSASRNVVLTPVQNSRPGTSQFPGVSLSPRTEAVPAASDKIIGPFPTCYNDSEGKIALTFSSAADLTIAVIQINSL